MRIFTIILVSFIFTSASAQIGLPGSFMNRPFGGSNAHYQLLSDSNNLSKKWSLNKYGGISTGFSFFNGGHATVLSAPIGLQVNRRLTNNLFAFAGLSVAPAYTAFNRSFGAFDLYKTGTVNNRIPTNGFGIYSRAEAGLMYINDERTFSISGSIGIERSSYPILYHQSFNNNFTAPTQQPFTGTR
jgi:hypothetical protein